MSRPKRKRPTSRGLTEAQFNTYIKQRLEDFRRQAERLAAAQRGDVSTRKIKIESYKVPSYTVGTHWRVITVNPKKG